MPGLLKQDRCAAYRAPGNQLRWNINILLPDGVLIIIDFVMAGSVVSLCVEQSLFIKACTLELVIHIGGQHKREDYRRA